MSAKTFVLSLVKLSLLVSFISCRPSDPVGELNRLVNEYGYIGHQNPLENAEPGTLLAGKPNALAFVAPAEDCFPEEAVSRSFDNSNINKKYSYNFVGSLGFLANGSLPITGGFGLESNHIVQVELNGIQIEYLSSIDITDYYLNGMPEACKLYLDDVGFVIQALSTSSLKLKIMKTSGTNIRLDPANIANYFQFDFGVNWQIVDEYTVEINSPKYIGYQLGRLRLEDGGRTLYRASSVSKDGQKFLFEAIGVFDDDEENLERSLEYMSSNDESELDKNSVYWP